MTFKSTQIRQRDECCPSSIYFSAINDSKISGVEIFIGRIL